MNNEDKKITAATISTKHLAEPEIGRQLGKPYMTKLAYTAAAILDAENIPRVGTFSPNHLQLNLREVEPGELPSIGRGMTRPTMFFADPYPFLGYWHDAIRNQQLRKNLHKKMFGSDRDVWDRFTREFHSWTPEYVHLKARIKPIESYWARDWLTNVCCPRVNQYDPVDYYKYCEHLQYDVQQSRARRKYEFYTGPRLVSAWSPSGIPRYNPFPIDNYAKEMLAQLIPAPYQSPKRIY